MDRLPACSSLSNFKLQGSSEHIPRLVLGHPLFLVTYIVAKRIHFDVFSSGNLFTCQELYASGLFELQNITASVKFIKIIHYSSSLSIHRSIYFSQYFHFKIITRLIGATYRESMSLQSMSQLVLLKFYNSLKNFNFILCDNSDNRDSSMLAK